MKIALSPADKKLLEEISSPDTLKDVGYIKKTFEGVEEWSNMLGDTTGRGRFTGAAGFGVGKDINFQKVAYIPTHVASALLLVDPDILTNKQKFYAWLRGPGKAYSFHRKVVKGAQH